MDEENHGQQNQAQPKVENPIARMFRRWEQTKPEKAAGDTASADEVSDSANNHEELWRIATEGFRKRIGTLGDFINGCEEVAEMKEGGERSLQFNERTVGEGYEEMDKYDELKIYRDGGVSFKIEGLPIYNSGSSYLASRGVDEDMEMSTHPAVQANCTIFIDVPSRGIQKFGISDKQSYIESQTCTDERIFKAIGELVDREGKGAFDDLYLTYDLSTSYYFLPDKQKKVVRFGTEGLDHEKIKAVLEAQGISEEDIQFPYENDVWVNTPLLSQDIEVANAALTLLEQTAKATLHQPGAPNDAVAA